MCLSLANTTKLVAEEVFETSNPAYEAFIYPDSPRLTLVDCSGVEPLPCLSYKHLLAIYTVTAHIETH